MTKQLRGSGALFSSGDASTLVHLIALTKTDFLSVVARVDAILLTPCDDCIFPKAEHTWEGGGSLNTVMLLPSFCVVAVHKRSDVATDSCTYKAWIVDEELDKRVESRDALSWFGRLWADRSFD